MRKQPGPCLHDVPGVDPSGFPALGEPRERADRWGREAPSCLISSWKRGAQQGHILAPHGPESGRGLLGKGRGAERWEPPSASVYPAAKHPGPPPTPTSRSPGRLGLAGENTPERVPWPPAQRPLRAVQGAVQGLGIRRAKQLFLTHCCEAAKCNRFHAQLRREGWRDTRLLWRRWCLLAASQRALPARSWGGISGSGPRSPPRPPGAQGAHLVGCRPGSRWARAAQPAGGGHGGRAASSAGRSQLLRPWQGEHRASPPRCQGREQTPGSCSAPAGWAPVRARLPPAPAWPAPTPTFSES